LPAIIAPKLMFPTPAGAGGRSSHSFDQPFDGRAAGDLAQKRQRPAEFRT
jgi:hypothetical protein